MSRLAFFVCALFLAALATQARAQELLILDGYCLYDGEQLSGDIYGFESNAEAQEAVKRVLDYTGLNQNFIIKAANVPNAAAVIQGQQRLILYSDAFMIQVRDITKTNWAAISIMAHEVGHHLNGHTILSGGSRPGIELEADRYSGYVLYRMGATLAEAQAAMNQLGSDVGSDTHPAKSARLAAITNGWQAAKDLATASTSTSTTPNPSPQPQAPVIPNPGATNPGQSASNFVWRVVFPMDPVAYFVTATDDIVGVPPGGVPTIIGRKLPPTVYGAAWMYSTAAVTYAVTPDGKVMGLSQWGAPFQIGHVTTP